MQDKTTILRHSNAREQENALIKGDGGADTKSCCPQTIDLLAQK